MHWFCEPAEFRVAQDEQIKVKTKASTDFWRKTHYGFIRDNGHFYHKTINQNFQATVAFNGKYKDLYDQAGFMLRISDTHWMKCGIEYVHGVKQASTVVTNDYSDWSVTPLPAEFDGDFHLKVVWQAPALEVFYRLDPLKEWTLMRLGYLSNQNEDQKVQFGLMTCSPDGTGFEVLFKDLKIELI